jgi:cytochrome c oxidase subunit III
MRCAPTPQRPPFASASGCSSRLLACWFTLTGVHVAHVAAGIAVNLWVAARARASTMAQLAERMHATRLYWYFVDLVWLAILVAFYLI